MWRFLFGVAIGLVIGWYVPVPAVEFGFWDDEEDDGY